MDRIKHPSLEEFKRRIQETRLHGRSVKEWTKILGGIDALENRQILQALIGVQK